MADDLRNRGPRDRGRISMDEEHEVRYWTQELGVQELGVQELGVQELGVSKERLASIIARVGDSADAVRRELGR